MSKYTPPFLKESKTPNRFSALSETPSSQSFQSTPSSSTPSSSTSSSSSSQSSLASGTMASLTKGNKSYSTSSESKKDQKSVNISSEDDFPSLGVKPVLPTIHKNDKFIKMAEDWGKKIEEDEEANRRRIINEEQERRRIAKELMKHTPHTLPTRRINKTILSETKNKYYDADLKIYKLIVDDTIEDDSIESTPSANEEEDDDDDEDTEINANLVNDRRHEYELY